MSLRRSKAVLELGKRLVAQLDADDDILAAWMAHDIAARIATAKAAPPDAKATAQADCARAILELWRHRNALPEHLRPLGELEPVLRSLASLDMERTDYRYHPETLRAAATANVREDVKRWFELAFGIDYTARLMIRYALRSAAQLPASNAEPWIELARRAGAEDDAEWPVVRFVLEKEDANEVATSGESEALKDRVRRLESFADVATALARELRAQLQKGRKPTKRRTRAKT